MTRTFALFALAGLLLICALVLRSSSPQPTTTPSAPSAPVAAPTPKGAVGPVSALDGLYFPGAGRTLTISRGQFILEDAAAPIETIRGAVHVSDDTLGLWSTQLKVTCAFVLEKGGLVIRDGRPQRELRPCHVLFRRADQDPRVSSWTLQLGQVGLTPFTGASAVGVWVDDEGRHMRVVAGPAPAAQPLNLEDPPFDLLHWNSNGSGVAFELLPLNHGMNHVDTDVSAFWVMTGPDTALHVWSGGCNEMDERVHSRAFRRRVN